MAKRKPKQIFSVRLEPLILEALTEASLGAGEILVGDSQEAKEAVREMTRTDWICIALHRLVLPALLTVINEKQVYGYAGTDEIFRLFTMYSRASRGIEGYGFTTEDKKTRFVYGPKIDK